MNEQQQQQGEQLEQVEEGVEDNLTESEEGIVESFQTCFPIAFGCTDIT